MTAPDPPHRRPAPEPVLPGPVVCTDGPDLCRVRLLSCEQWDALPPHERPARAAHVPGLGWVVASPVEYLN